MARKIFLHASHRILSYQSVRPKLVFNTRSENVVVRAISASEANQNFSRLLRDVQGGESFVILSRGRAVARLGPVDEAAATSQAVDDLLAYLATQPRRTAGEWTRDDLYR